MNPDLSIDLRSESDKSVYFWLLSTYLLYDAIITKKKEAKTYIVFLLSLRVGSLPTCLFCQQPQQFLCKQIL